MTSTAVTGATYDVVADSNSSLASSEGPIQNFTQVEIAKEE
jgi:hypothetical protein